MQPLLVLFGASIVFELLAYGVWRWRKLFAALAWLATIVACGWLVIGYFGVWSLLVGLIGLYRIFNHARLLNERMHEAYLRKASQRTAVVFVGLQLTAGLLWWGWQAWGPSGQLIGLIVAGAQLGAALVLALTVHRRLQRTAWPAKVARLSDSELPTITVAIPARNENEDLRACLESLLRSDYPKMEVLVLDDCSQDKRTSEIIRSFAQAGVRFIKGDTPHETWLAKNQAYDRLAKAASGDYLLYCGVDVRFAPGSLRQIMATLLAKKKRMLCILPWRADKAQGLALTQAMRYWWELAPPRRLFHRPPVLSTCWIIEKKVLEKFGAFAACKRSIVPEAHFARQLVAGDSYSFLRSSKALGIESQKSTLEQQATAIRTRYPQLRRRPENVCLLALAELATLVLPFVLVVAGFWLPIGWLAHLLVALTCALLIVTFLRLTRTTRTNSWQFGLVGMPLGALYDIGLMHYSMWRYEFSTVEWKGRNVCIPAMHVIPHLPKL
jgi:hypothetical protein